MNFSTFTKISSGNLIYFRNESPIENVGTLKFYKDNSSGTFLKKEFRWSFDRNYWSSWETLNIGNIAKVNTGNNRYLFFEIKYTMTSPTAGKVTSFAVEYILNPNETYAPAVEDVTNMDNNHILPDGCNDLGGTTKTFKTIEITDAETLCGKSCDHYLWRPNHKGTQPISSVEGLQNILNNLTSAGDISTSHVFYDPALDPSLAMPNTVGGIPAGTTVYDLQGDSLRSILNDLLFPTVNPTYVAPSGSFNDNVANLQEIGAMINPQFTASFSRGQILVSGNFQDYRSGLPNQYVFTDASANTLLIDASSTSLSNIQTVNNYLVKIGTQSFTSRIYYDAGPQPYDNKGNPYGTPLSAGSVGPYSTSFEGVYPLFATTSNITTLTQQTLVSMLTGNNISMTLVAETGGNKQKFEIPTAWTGAPTNKPLLGILTYNSVSGNYEYQGGLNLPSTIAADREISLTYWTIFAVTESVQGNTINYTRYEYNGTDRGSVQIRLVF